MPRADERRRPRVPARRRDAARAARGRGARRARAQPPRRALRGRRPRGDAAAALPARGRLSRTASPSSSTTPTRSRRRSASSTCTSPAGPPRAALREARRARARGRRRRRHRVRGLGAERALGQRRRRLQPLGRAPAPDALARRHRDLGALRARRRGRRALQVRAPDAGRRRAAARRPGRARDRGAAADRVGRLRARARVAGRRRGSSAAARRTRSHEPMSIYEVHLGSWRQGLSLRASSPSSSARYVARPRLHARRADAGDGAPVRRLVGLPGDRLLRADLALRHARRLPRVRRLAAPAGDRRDPRLGARALPARRVGARPLRRHARSTSTPTRGAARTPTGARSSSTSARNEVRNFLLASALLLAARVPRRRPARRRGRLDALPRLLAQAEGEWIPNVHGGREDLDAIAFLRELNERRPRARARRDLGRRGVDRRGRASRGRVYLGGLGFGFKWNMGWMHDTLGYFAARPDLPPATTTTS